MSSPGLEDLSRLSVAELAERLKTDQSGASHICEEILIRFRPLLHKSWLEIAQAVSQNIEEEDFVQDVLLRLLSSIHALRNPHAFPGYLRAIVQAVKVDHCKRAGQLRPDPEALVPETAVDTEDLHKELIIESYLKLLPERERQVLQYVLFGGSSGVDGARELGLSPSSFRSTKAKGLKRLRKIVREEMEQIEKKS